MKIRSAECLALVAIVTSATVMQIREHMQDTTAPPATQAASSCGALPNGPVPASCETARAATRDERPAEPPRHSPGIWV